MMLEFFFNPIVNQLELATAMDGRNNKRTKPEIEVEIVSNGHALAMDARNSKRSKREMIDFEILHPHAIRPSAAKDGRNSKRPTQEAGVENLYPVAAKDGRNSKRPTQETGVENLHLVAAKDGRNSKRPTQETGVDNLHPVASNGHALGIVRSLREGAHYTLKIESFSLYLNSEIESYESQAFEAGGYKWKLCLYPNGNNKRNVNGHISLYLALADTESLPLGWEINVNMQLFVFDHIRDRYLTIQDAEGGIRCFHRMKTEWGFDEFLPLDKFNDASSGYLLDDCCVFGAEVLVTKHNSKGECVSMIKDPPKNTYTWKISSYSATEHKTYLDTEDFVIGDNKWKLWLYPNGQSTARGKSMSLYLSLADWATHPPERKVYAEYTLRIKDQVHGKHLEKKGKKWFWSLNQGFADFVELGDLNDESKGFKVNDTVIVEAQITRMSGVKAFLK